MPPSARIEIFAAAELAGGHIALHDVHAVLRVERHAGNFIEADHVILADQSPLAARHVHKHARNRRLAAGDQMRVGRDLLEKVALARAAGTKFYQIVVPFDERNHPQEGDSFRALIERRGLEPDGTKQKIDPVRGRFEARAPGKKSVEDVRARHLNGAQGEDAERATILLLRDHAVEAERDLGIEAVDENALVLLDHAVGDANVLQCKARKFGDVAGVLGVQAGPDGVDQAHGAFAVGLVLENFFLSGANAAVFQLPLDDIKAFLDFVLVGRRAVATEQELDDVGRHWVGLGVFPHQILAHDEAFKGLGAEVIQAIQLQTHARSPTAVALASATLPCRSSRTTCTFSSSSISSDIVYLACEPSIVAGSPRRLAPSRGARLTSTL